LGERREQVVKIYPTIKVTSHSIIVELRDNDDQTSGYIGARKSLDYESMAIGNAEVIFSISFNHSSRIIGYTPEKAQETAHLINRACLVCELLDHHIREGADFKKTLLIKAAHGGRSITLDVCPPPPDVV